MGFNISIYAIYTLLHIALCVVELEILAEQSVSSV